MTIVQGNSRRTRFNTCVYLFLCFILSSQRCLLNKGSVYGTFGACISYTINKVFLKRVLSSDLVLLGFTLRMEVRKSLWKENPAKQRVMTPWPLNGPPWLWESEAVPSMNVAEKMLLFRGSRICCGLWMTVKIWKGKKTEALRKSSIQNSKNLWPDWRNYEGTMNDKIGKSS